MNELKEKFENWMMHNTVLSNSSISKYSSAISTISKDMIKLNVISSPLFNMSLSDLTFYIPKILNNDFFYEKNKRGNYMYSNALKQFRGFMTIEQDTLKVDDGDRVNLIIEKIQKDYTISITERKELIKARMGQGVFRDSLLQKYNNSCLISGINFKHVLVASHIKPWIVSNNDERLSSENGLLLSATYDKLFDGGYISFNSDGKIWISSLISMENRKRMNIDSSVKIDLKASNELLLNLEYHRDTVFIK